MQTVCACQTADVTLDVGVGVVPVEVVQTDTDLERMVLVDGNAVLDHVVPAIVVALVAVVIEHLGEGNTELCSPTVIGEPGLTHGAGVNHIVSGELTGGVDVQTIGVDVDLIANTQDTVVVRLLNGDVNILAVANDTEGVEDCLCVGHLLSGVGIVLQDPADLVTEVDVHLEQVAGVVVNDVRGIQRISNGVAETNVVVNDVECNVQELAVSSELSVHHELLRNVTVVDPRYGVPTLDGNDGQVQSLPVLEREVLEIEHVSGVSHPSELKGVVNGLEVGLVSIPTNATVGIGGNEQSAKGQDHCNTHSNCKNLFHVCFLQ